jgi:trans-2-enoyl-CoA reductase
LKPIGDTFTNKTVDFHSGKVSEVSIEQSNGDDIENTVKVMGGEDWEVVDALKEKFISSGATTVAYSYRAFINRGYRKEQLVEQIILKLPLLLLQIV